jgi:UDPglucose 6-dehydrogenase
MLKITIVGGGYIGVVSGVCFCKLGFSVDIVEIDAEKLQNLKNGMVSVYESSLEFGLKKHQALGTLRCFESLSDTHHEPDVIVVATPYPGHEGTADSILDVIREISLMLRRSHYSVILIKTTTPVGTCSIIEKNMQFLRPDLVLGDNYDIVTHPDFLREGYALHDFMMPDRLVIGIDQNSKKAMHVISKLYATIISSEVPVIYTNYETAELIKYATTSFVVTKIALINEFADLCRKSNANLEQLISGVGMDSRVGTKLLEATPGFGGASFPALTNGVIRIAQTLGLEFRIMQAVMESNDARIKEISSRIISKFDNNNGMECRKLAILGMTYKPQTNDIAGSPSMAIIQDLLNAGICVSAYDPSLLPNKEITWKIVPNTIIENPKFQLVASAYEAVTHSDMIAVMTAWTDFLSIDFGKVRELMNKEDGKQPTLIDMCNMFVKTNLKDFEYISEGNS